MDRSLAASWSQSHRPDLVNSHEVGDEVLGIVKRGRNPTVLIWSIPTLRIISQLGVEGDPVAIPPS